jgi:hypothetical protein
MSEQENTTIDVFDDATPTVADDVVEDVAGAPLLRRSATFGLRTAVLAGMVGSMTLAGAVGVGPLGDIVVVTGTTCCAG